MQPYVCVQRAPETILKRFSHETVRHDRSLGAFPAVANTSVNAPPCQMASETNKSSFLRGFNVGCCQTDTGSGFVDGPTAPPLDNASQAHPLWAQCASTPFSSRRPAKQVFLDGTP